ncbi:MAG: hypothetical protein II295_05380 [Akkermansia sp.]|nr:hypothetical protein [Akkermansia sp.]
MKNPVTPQELQETFDRIITEEQKRILEAKPKNEKVLDYKDIERICNIIQGTYCSIMQVPQVPLAIVKACKEVLTWYRPIQITSGLYPYPRPTSLDIIKKACKSLMGIPAPDDPGVQKLRAALKEALTQL